MNDMLDIPNPTSADQVACVKHSRRARMPGRHIALPCAECGEQETQQNWMLKESHTHCD
jgi:hypothetical protein